jgi:2-C-methyl-D-erythritol 2,4-cyclodiphosphate synthase
MKGNIRIGIGYDIHRLTPGRPLILGGVNIPSPHGLTGWSDADILTHAIIDALLGAAALGDIGTHFPPGDPQYKDISSLVLLKRIMNMLNKEGYRVNNIDTTVVTEQPKLRDFIHRIRQKLSQVLGIAINQVSVKASTSAQLGSVGQGGGMVAWAIASIESISD